MKDIDVLFDAMYKQNQLYRMQDHELSDSAYFTEHKGSWFFVIEYNGEIALGIEFETEDEE